MAMKTFTVFAASYDAPGPAEADFQALREFYMVAGLLDTYDAAVIARDDDGKVRIVVKHEPPARQGAWGGLGIGLADGALVALFPAVSTGAVPLPAAAGGASLCVLAGHVSAGLKRADLKDLGELLDGGRSGLVVVAARDVAGRVEHFIRHANKLTGKPLQADETAAAEDIEAAAGQDQSYQRAVAQSEAAVREAEAEAAAAERTAERYSAFPPRPEGDSLASQLGDLAKLREAGVLSPGEFEAAKSRLLGG